MVPILVNAQSMSSLDSMCAFVWTANLGCLMMLHCYILLKWSLHGFLLHSAGQVHVWLPCSRAATVGMVASGSIELHGSIIILNHYQLSTIINHYYWLWESVSKRHSSACDLACRTLMLGWFLDWLDRKATALVEKAFFLRNLRNDPSNSSSLHILEFHSVLSCLSFCPVCLNPSKEMTEMVGVETCSSWLRGLFLPELHIMSYKIRMEDDFEEFEFEGIVCMSARLQAKTSPTWRIRAGHIWQSESKNLTAKTGGTEVLYWRSRYVWRYL